MKTPQESIEEFHLIFLDQLSRNLDKALYAIKGGCNLRFFFHSIRYSEDLDIDVKTIATNTLKSKIDKILKGSVLKQILRTRKLEIEHVSSPKQTETTQRWKITLKTDLPLRLNTKIEFSRRKFHEGVQFDPVNAELIQKYHLGPILCAHYTPSVAIQQKFEALAGRAQTQVRDLFDIYFLMMFQGILPEKKTISASLIEKAKLNAMTVTFGDYKSQVVAYLPPEYQPQYGTIDFWERMVDEILEKIELIKS